ncbi:MAG: hypothetical protein KKI13_07950, partial [Candidatus Omnitrophica bacterium]|nr:hypothetical protein [Candidatus Omnitrophota bacterium]
NNLKKAGYDVIYKVHPDRTREVDGIFEEKAEIRKGYVEDCLDRADAFLFGSIRTSAFATILCTNKPIIALRMESDEPFKPSSEKAMECLKKRCRFVNAGFDERNRIIFDESELIRALSRKPEPPNNEFIETYMFLKRAK